MQRLPSTLDKRSVPLFLVGPMGSGKTTLGKGLSSALNIPFIDMDDEIIAEDGRSIPKIFKQDGEEGFRKIETEVLKEVLGRNSGFCVISGGGGIILKEENRSLIINHTLCLYLYCNVDTQFARVAGDANRPVIAGDLDQRAKLEKIFAVRDPLFCSMCHMLVPTGTHSLASCIAYVISSLAL